MKYVAIFHANLNYASLTPDRYEFVIRSSYELILDVMEQRFPEVPFVFEASGYTIEQIARKTPDVLEKLKKAVKEGRCEFMGSPYAHPMLPNFPHEDGIWSIRFSNRAYRRHLGMEPASFWNPECGWRDDLPVMIEQCGYKNLLGDFEAYSRSCDADGRPLRPEIYEKEHTDEPAFYNFGFEYDLPGGERGIHFPFANLEGEHRGKLKVFLRTDRVAQFGVRYFMGMEGYTLEEYLKLIDKYSCSNTGEPEGALVIFADDAEYVGTNGWFRLKYQNEPDNVFEHTPECREKLEALIRACCERGRFVTFGEACSLPPLDDRLSFDNDSAWHGARASTWAKTPMARLLRPWQDLVRESLKRKQDAFSKELYEQAWFHLTNSYNSDGQWPPTLPEAPHIVHPYNYRYCFNNLLRSEMITGGVDRGRLDTDPSATLEEILGPQQQLVLEKANSMADSNDPAEREGGLRARGLIESSRNLDPVKTQGSPILFSDDYAVRAESLMEARRLVGGVVIENVSQ